MTRWLDVLSEAVPVTLAALVLAVLFSWVSVLPTLGVLWLLGAL